MSSARCGLLETVLVVSISFTASISWPGAVKDEEGIETRFESMPVDLMCSCDEGKEDSMEGNDGKILVAAADMAKEPEPGPEDSEL